MKILVLGAGVLGCNLAKNLYLAGKDITLLARGKWYEQVKRGLVIKNKLTFSEKIYAIKVTNELKENDFYDVIFVCVQYTQLDGILPILFQNISKNIVFIGNNLKTEYYAKLLRAKNVLFGFTLAAGHREIDKVVSIDLRNITIGNLKGYPTRKSLIKRVFKNTKYKLKYERNMRDYLICHAAFVVPVAYACYYVNGDLKRAGGNNSFIHKIIRANIEVFFTLEKQGYELLPQTLKGYKTRKFRFMMFMFYKLMATTFLGQVCASEHAMSAIEEMKVLAKDLDKIIYKSGEKLRIYRELRDRQNYI